MFFGSCLWMEVGCSRSCIYVERSSTVEALDLSDLQEVNRCSHTQRQMHRLNVISRSGVNERVLMLFWMDRWETQKP